MQSSPTILLAVVCVFLLLLLGMVAFAVYVIRKESANKAKIAHALGLSPAADTQPLLQRVAYINGISRPDMYRLEHIFQRHHVQGGDVYFFSLHRRDIKSRTLSQPSGSSKIHYFPLELSALAFVSPNWKLPRFTAIPRLDGGTLAEIGNTLSEKALDIKHEIIKFPHILHLDERYLIASLDIHPAEVRPSDGFFRVLASHPNLRLNMGGDTLTLSYANSNSQTPDEEKMKQLYKIGLELAGELV